MQPDDMELIDLYVFTTPVGAITELRRRRRQKDSVIKDRTSEKVYEIEHHYNFFSLRNSKQLKISPCRRRNATLGPRYEKLCCVLFNLLCGWT